MEIPKTNEIWKPLSEELGDEFKGWFLHTKEEDGWYIDVYRFWIEPFDQNISLTPENLHYGIFHHCLDKEAFELSKGNIDINSLKTISLYSEDAPTFKKIGRIADEEERASARLEIQQEIQRLPKYLALLKDVIQGKLEPSDAELQTGAVLSATIL